MIKLSTTFPKKEFYEKAGETKPEMTVAACLLPIVERALKEHLAGKETSLPETISIKIDLKDGEAFVVVS